MIRSLWSRAVSFRRPDGPELDDVPEVGSDAPERPRVGSGRPRVVLFLRHIGCAFGETMLKDLREVSREHPEMEFIAVTHGDPEAATNWCRQLGIGTVEVERVTGETTSVEWCQDVEDSDIRVFVDPERETYAEWGLGLGGANHLLDPRVLWNLLKVHLGGSRDRESSGSRWQRAGMFAIDGEGVVRAVHTADYAGDMPDVEVATTFLAGETASEDADAVFDDYERGWVVGEAGAAEAEGEAVEADAEPATPDISPVSETESVEPTPAITRISESDAEHSELPAADEDLTPAAVPVDRSAETAGADADDRTRVRTDGGN